ncbi:Glycosyl transferases group 1 [Prosthecobacter debontii]|uniref:Glycosyl transferases group 1 n=1 Tax=Prosthecobacter debontii TaxID=48467 RepID=A0A1T4YVE3_9BACT|nr:Glycosyl transferases group 1 [Prosthecobacter debontii]
MLPPSQTSEKRVLWMDPRFQARRPTTQSLYQSLPDLLEKGWQVELWCLEHDTVDERVKVVTLPQARWLRLLEPLWFWALAWAKLTWKRACGESWDIVHTSGPDIPGADVMSLHFHNRTWIRLQWQENARTWKERLKVFHTLIGVTQESLALGSRRWRVILPVSEGLANRIRSSLPANKIVRVLPNLLDGQRFSPAVRERWREAGRATMQVSETDYVLSFVSTGHYQRKGLWAAVEALHAIRSQVHADCGLNLQFWVIGVSEHTVPSLRRRLDEIAPTWAEWVRLLPPTDEVERWYAAADAFLFPSRYETFSLVALEASACGLPILVTPYDGHEMYLQDGVNGCLLPWEIKAMSERLLQFFIHERFQMKPGPTASLSPADYAAVLDDSYRDLLESKKP